MLTKHFRSELFDDSVNFPVGSARVRYRCDLLINKRKKYKKHIIIGARLADKDSIPAKRYYANKIANFWIAWASGSPMSISIKGNNKIIFVF
jgi:hypothetical protein